MASGHVPNDKFDEALPKKLEDVRFDCIRDVVNVEVARFLNSMLDSYVGMLCIIEKKLKNERLGTNLIFIILRNFTNISRIGRDCQDW